MTSGLKQLRDQRGLTRTELGFHLRVSGDLIAAIENGKRRVTLDLLRTMSDFFGMRLDVIADIVAPREPADSSQQGAL